MVSAEGRIEGEKGFRDGEESLGIGGRGVTPGYSL